MNKRINVIETSGEELLEMIETTSEIAAKNYAEQLGQIAASVKSSNNLTNEVEFWKWMSRNYKPSNIFDSNQTMMQYISEKASREEWVAKQIQGKGYEWDWMQAQRREIKNIFKIYDAGDVVNRAASDVTETNLITGTRKEYQMKAYTSKTNPNLKNTSKDITVVTNAEKVDVVRGNGYTVEEFQNADQIKKSTAKRVEKVKDGKANTAYTFENVAGTMACAGVIGFVISAGFETIGSYRSWKQGDLNDKEYLIEVLKAGGEGGVTSAATAGIMIPVSAAITAVGASTLITIPIAIVINAGVDSIVAPCFGRGKYKKILVEAKYYQNLELMNKDMIQSMTYSVEQYALFLESMRLHYRIHQNQKTRSEIETGRLMDLYNSI